jgi:hypothetical protein
MARAIDPVCHVCKTRTAWVEGTCVGTSVASKALIDDVHHTSTLEACTLVLGDALVCTMTFVYGLAVLGLS